LMSPSAHLLLGLLFNPEEGSNISLQSQTSSNCIFLKSSSTAVPYLYTIWYSSKHSRTQHQGTWTPIIQYRGTSAFKFTADQLTQMGKGTRI
jgi:hypothetical protein